MTPTAELEAPALAPKPVSITEATVCLHIRFGLLGNSRKVSTSQIEIDSDKTLIHVSKTLLDSPELKAIGHHDGALVTWLKGICLPSLFKAGVYLVPIKGVQLVEARLKKGVDERKTLVEKFITAYLGRVAEAEVRLKSQYNPMDYPGEQEVRSAFVYEWAYVSFSTPTKLKEISAEFFQQEQQKAAEKWSQATDEVQQLLRATLKDMVEHLVDRLTPGEDGKPKRFHSSTVEKMSEFLNNFSIRDVTNDTELALVVNSCKQLLSGVSPENLRKDDGQRTYIQQAFGLVKNALDGLVVEGGSRKIILDDEGDE